MKKFAVIGDPIGHSLSPLMHKVAFDELNIEAEYLAIQISSNDLASKVKEFRQDKNLIGFNVTIPHKEAIQSLLDETIDNEAGAINTVKKINEKLIGYNTDGAGFIESLAQFQIDQLKKGATLVIGAGGAAHGICYALKKANFQDIYITNRHLEKAKCLADRTDCSAITLENAERKLSHYQLIINTTPVGMHPHINETPISTKNLKSKTVVVDIIYNPIKTKFLFEAEKAGALIQNGVDMFVNQGAIALEIWTDLVPNRKRMKQAVLAVLEQTGNP